MKLAHIINPVIVNESSDLYHAQPMTFKSMHKAKEKSLKMNPENPIELLSCTYEEDSTYNPRLFTQTRSLDRSILDFIKPKYSRKLPFIKDILDRCNEYAADYLIYTNVDIALTEDFYIKVQNYIKLGHDAIIINRTTMPSYNDQSLEWYLENIESGKPHPGYDCFIIKKELYEMFILGKIAIGINWIGEVLLRNIFKFSQNPILLQQPKMTFHMGDDLSWTNPKFEDQRQFNQNEANAIINQLNK